MLHGYKIIDADSHVIEPQDMWVKYLEPEFKDFAPSRDMKIKGESITEKISQQVQQEGNRQMMQAHPHAYLNRYNAESHVQSMVQMGVDLAFVYPTYGLWLFAINNLPSEVMGAFTRAYNTWLFEEYCSYDPGRLKGVGAINLHSPPKMVKELHRLAKYGAKAVFLRPNPIKGRLLSDPIEGTLAYIAPEQTGRMNRGIGYRSDFYSLGVTFYELLTNKLPFVTNDPMELVHCHLAQQPLPVYEIIPNIPLAISTIIDKLLAKTPEERYQSAWGIKADLETCLNQLKSQGQISQFLLGIQDITEKFHIPQKLYGREQEVNRLLAAFEQVSQGATGMVLISGYSGIGKSALVNEIHKPITKQRGQFISGKFDQLQRDIPYSAIVQAFQDLIRKLLSEPEIKLQTWKHKILEALGNNGQIIIDVIPELKKIIGKQPPVEQLGKTESQNRFNFCKI